MIRGRQFSSLLTNQCRQPPSRDETRLPEARIDPTLLAPDPLTTVGRLVLAMIMGALIGLNRELRDKPAGMRTHGLVALGSALVTLVSTHIALSAGQLDGNPVGRTIQGIVAGIGFLGAGVILKTQEHGSVRGLTTAATIWLVACLGVAAGAGLWVLAGTTFGLAMFLLLLGGPIEHFARRVLPRASAPSPRHRLDPRGRRTPAGGVRSDDGGGLGPGSAPLP
ncbi:MAG TPA: MgtC/SapB family protein [Gemmatimonadaceae bacterium]|nr:MgtC/SapB family protein [Gemmatimonadaceae bacterium]